MRAREALAGALFCAVTAFVIVLESCAPSIDDLTYWTGYYEHRMNVPIADIDFVESYLPCPKKACLCVIPMTSADGVESFQILYSTARWCGFGTTGKRTARRALCRIRMATWAFPETAARDTKECMEWYDN